MIHITMDGPPKGKGRPRFGNGRAYTPPETAAYEERLGWAARQAMRGMKPIAGPVRMIVKIFLPIPRSWPKARRSDALDHYAPIKPDWDNAGKMTDALTGICWIDDAQVVDGRVIKVFSERPRIEITIEEVYEKEMD